MTCCSYMFSSFFSFFFAVSLLTFPLFSSLSHFFCPRGKGGDSNGNMDTDVEDSKKEITLTGGKVPTTAVRVVAVGNHPCCAADAPPFFVFCSFSTYSVFVK